MEPLFCVSGHINGFAVLSCHQSPLNYHTNSLGAVAQLVERCNRTAEVESSNLFRSTKRLCSLLREVAGRGGKRLSPFSFWRSLQTAANFRPLVLSLILRLQCAAFCAACRPVEMFVGRLGVMLQTDLGIMSHPLGHHMDGEHFQ